VAAAAYRAGAVITDERSGRTHRYQHRKGVVASFILTPPHAPDIFQSRAHLWNAAEDAETRKNSRVAREIILALPHELSGSDRQALTRDMGLWLVERYGVVVDTALHSPVAGDGHDPRNHHAHLLFTTREVTEEGLGKKTRILDDKEQGPHEIEMIRDVWEALANAALRQAGYSDMQIDKRTLEDQGIDRIPQIHVGPEAKGAEKLKERQEESEKTEDDEEGDSEGSGKGDAGSTGGPTLKSKTVEDGKGREIDYKTVDQTRSRTDFVEEIKRINNQRAVYSDFPLAVQIDRIERLMDRLDNRVKNFETLYSRTSLPHALKRSIIEVIRFSKTLLMSRIQARETVQTFKEERKARFERQYFRYGQPYRVGIHQQIREMKFQLQRLEQTADDYKRYKGFVDHIEKEIKGHPSIIFSEAGRSGLPQRYITTGEMSLKLALKADLVRSSLPDHVAAKITSQKERGVRLTETYNQNYLHPVKTEAKADLNFKVSFNAPSTLNQKADFNPSYVQKMSERIPGLQHAIAEYERSNPSPKISFIPASEITTRWQEEIIRDWKRENPQSVSTTKHDDSSMQRRHFNLNSVDHVSVRRAVYGQEREKVRQESAIARERVPPKYSAEPYSSFSEETLKPKMSDRFNSSAFDPAHEPVASDPELKRNPPPEGTSGGDFRI